MSLVESDCTCFDCAPLPRVTRRTMHPQTDAGVTYVTHEAHPRNSELYRVNENFAPRTQYSPIALARMFTAAPALVEAAGEILRLYNEYVITSSERERHNELVERMVDLQRAHRLATEGT